MKNEVKSLRRQAITFYLRDIVPHKTNNAYFINVFKSKHRLQNFGNFADVKKEEIQLDADKFLAIFYNGRMQTISRCNHFTEFR